MKISQAEMDTLMLLWECNEPIRPASLLKMMTPIRPWSISTLKTILTRLVDKGYVEITLQKRFFYYYPKYTKEEFLKKETGILLDRLSDCSAVPLMAGLISSESITKEELDEIEALIQEEKARLAGK